MKTFSISLLVSLMAATVGVAQKGRAETLEGNQLYSEQRYEEALDRYTQGLENAPDSPILQFNIGNADYKLEKFQEASEAYDKTLGAESEHVTSQALYNLGNTYYRLGKYQESVAAYKESLRLNPNDGDAKFNLEKALQALQINPPQQSPEQQESEDQEDQEERQESDQPSGERQTDRNSEDSTEEGDRPQDRDQLQQSSQTQPDEQETRKGEEDQPKLGQPEKTSAKNQERVARQPEHLPMTREQAEQLLEALKENQKDFLKRRVARDTPRVEGKDW